jgi:aerobic carbon-monoxide dehydrogenase medium subunit
VKPHPFLYVRPGSLEEALSILSEHGDDAKILAGGQSLIPLLNFRLARPDVLIDIGLIEEIQQIRVDDGTISIGAGVRQRAAEISVVVRNSAPLVCQSISYIGHLQNRNRGTVGGSIAHADPASELPATVSALGATMVVRSVNGERLIPADEFFVGPLTTALETGEMLCEIRIPIKRSARSHIIELSTRAGDFALAGVAGQLVMAGETVGEIDLVAFGVASTPLRLTDAEAVIRGRAPSPDVLDEVAASATSAVDDTFGDIHSDGAYRAAIVGEYSYRVLHEMTR